MQATIEIITNPIDVTQGTSEVAEVMTFDISPSYIKGDDGITPHIGANGNWYIGTTDTNVKARATDGADGVTPHIGSNGNWFFGTTDSGVKASGNDGRTPSITATKQGTTTTIKSDGVAIATINDGEDGTSDYNELNNKPNFKTINSENIVGEGNIVVGGGDSVWELLIDDTTTEEIQCWTFNQGKDGQVFDSYKELIMFLVYQPSSIAKTVLQIGFSGVGAWSKGYMAIGISPNLATLYAIISCKKTPFGIVVNTNQSQNNSSLSVNLTNYLQNNYQMVVNATANALNPSSSIGLKSYSFEKINLGSYSTSIGIDSRLVIYGKK